MTLLIPYILKARELWHSLEFKRGVLEHLTLMLSKLVGQGRVISIVQLHFSLNDSMPIGVFVAFYI
jgi:hypothetical protein